MQACNDSNDHFCSAVYLADKGEHTALYKIHKHVCIKPQKEYVIMLYFLHTTHTPHTCSRKFVRNVTGKDGGGRRQRREETELKSFIVVLFVEVLLYVPELRTLLRVILYTYICIVKVYRYL